MNASERDLASGFLQSCAAHPERPAVEVAGATLTYWRLWERAAAIAATLAHFEDGESPPLTAVLAYRSETAFAGVLGALLHGHGYVPLNPAFPSGRNREILALAGSRTLIVDRGSLSCLGDVLGQAEKSLLLVLPEHADVGDLEDRWPQHRFVGVGDLLPAGRWKRSKVSSRAVAYLLFTSGSTGHPKGVPVSHRNALAFLDNIVPRLDLSEIDRLSQVFEMTFDLSVFDMFAAWERGACVCCPSRKVLIKPGTFIRAAGLTIWFSVPSTGLFMNRLGMLKPGSYPGLRWSLFCGEPLPVRLASAWAVAAPNSRIENLYGPTEVSVACTAYTWDPSRSPGESEGRTVPIGAPFPGLSARVVDADLRQVAPGSDGELLMSGPQVVAGYWQDPGHTRERFVKLPGSDAIWYRTGDRVRLPAPGAPMTYLGRLDDQVKILGHRVELGEVEAALRAATGEDAVAAVGWPRTESGAAGIEAFLAVEGIDVDALRRDLEARLPDYMVPRRFHVLETLPLNPNGKTDRRALVAILDGPS